MFFFFSIFRQIVVNSAISVCEKFELWEVALEFLDPNSSAVSFGAALGAFDLGAFGLFPMERSDVETGGFIRWNGGKYGVVVT